MLDIIRIPAFKDNYIWLLRLPSGKDCWVVDPGEAQPVQDYLQRHQLQLEGILLTHHHTDHTGGVDALRTATTQVIGAASDRTRLPALTRAVTEGDHISLLDTDFLVMEIPGHTRSHLAFFAATSTPPLVFCGDTLFAGGCGRIFEGTPAQMHESLQRLAQLPANTLIYAAHEYTLSNLEFAGQVEPDNARLQERLSATREARSRDLPTLPSSLDTERATNPFLRLNQPRVQQQIQGWARDTSLTDPVALLAALREWKNQS